MTEETMDTTTKGTELTKDQIEARLEALHERERRVVDRLGAALLKGQVPGSLRRELEDIRCTLDAHYAASRILERRHEAARAR